MNLRPSHAALWRRIVIADDTACEGMSGGCRYCKSVVETLRGGSVMCPDCDHINAIGHSCSDWREYDDKTIDRDEVDRRWREREASRFPTTSNPTEFSIRMLRDA